MRRRFLLPRLDTTIDYYTTTERSRRLRVCGRTAFGQNDDDDGDDVADVSQIAKSHETCGTIDGQLIWRDRWRWVC